MSLIRNNYWHFIFFFIITSLLYSPALGSQFIDDFFTLFELFKIQGIKGYWDSFGFTSLYYINHALYLLVYKIVGFNSFAWYLVFSFVHSLNTFLGYLFLKNVLDKNEIANSKIISICAALIFLTSPYNTENLIWGATLHYGICMFCLWVCIYSYAKYLATNRSRYLWLQYMFFLISLLSIEITLVFPAILFLTFTFLLKDSTFINAFKRNLKLIVFPYAVIIAAYFICTKIIKGHYIGHYGSETHLKNLNLETFAATFAKYLSKIIFFTQYWAYSIKEMLCNFFNTHAFLIAIALLLVAILFVCSFYFKRKRLSVALLLLALAFIFLLPVLNMYFAYLNSVENDRLSYIASFFIYASLIVAISFFGKNVLVLFTTLFVACNLYFLIPNINNWQKASMVQNNFVDSFKWQNADNLFFLNVPCYYNGVYVFRNKSRVYRALFMLKDIDVKEKINHVSWYNMSSLNDSVIIEQIADNKLRVVLSNWNNWYWLNNQGAGSYENEKYKVEYFDNLHVYEVTFKNLDANDKVLYYTKNGLKEFQFNLPQPI